MVLNVFRWRAIFLEQKIMAGQAYRFLPAQDTWWPGGGCNSEICVRFVYLFCDPLLGHHFLFAHMSKAWRAIHERPAGNFWSISYDFFHFLDRVRQVYMGKKIKCWKCPWRVTFGPRLRGLAGRLGLPRHRGSFLARGPGVKNHCTRRMSLMLPDGWNQQIS